MITSEKPQLSVILEERVVKPSVPKLEVQVSLSGVTGSSGDDMGDHLVTMWELLMPSCFPNLNEGLLWNVTADIELEESDDGSLHDLAVIHHLLDLKVKKHGKKLPTGPSEGNLFNNWMGKGTCVWNRSLLVNYGRTILTVSEAIRKIEHVGESETELLDELQRELNNYPGVL